MFLDGEVVADGLKYELRCGKCGDRVAVLDVSEIVPIALRQSRLSEVVLCFDCDPEKVDDYVPDVLWPGLWNSEIVTVDDEFVIYERGGRAKSARLSCLPHFNTSAPKVSADNE